VGYSFGLYSVWVVFRLGCIPATRQGLIPDEDYSCGKWDKTDLENPVSMPPVGVFDGKMYVGTDVENTGPERMVKVDADKNCIEMCILEIISTGLVCVI